MCFFSPCKIASPSLAKVEILWNKCWSDLENRRFWVVPKPLSQRQFVFCWCPSLGAKSTDQTPWIRRRSHAYRIWLNWQISYGIRFIVHKRCNTISTLHSIITLHGMALHGITLHCVASPCITVYNIASHHIAMHCIASYYVTVHAIALHYITLHCMAFHGITLHYITLHYIAVHCVTLRYTELRCMTSLTLHFWHCIPLRPSTCKTFHSIPFHQTFLDQ